MAGIFFDIEIIPPGVFFDIEIVPPFNPDSVTWATSEDCTLVTVTIPNLLTGATYSSNVSVFADSVLINSVFALNGTTGTVTFPAAKDAVYSIKLTHGTEGEVLDKPIFISCRANKCFQKLNNRNADNYSDSLQDSLTEMMVAKGVLRAALAAYKKGQHQRATDLLASLATICTDFNCHCGC